eukprot:3201602-Amphidinium_carterae.1
MEMPMDPPSNAPKVSVRSPTPSNILGSYDCASELVRRSILLSFICCVCARAFVSASTRVSGFCLSDVDKHKVMTVLSVLDSNHMAVSTQTKGVAHLPPSTADFDFANAKKT